MYQYTKNNHFKFGYNYVNKFQERTSPDDKFTAEYGSIEQNITDWRQANLLAAKTIYDNKVDDVWILLSGGMDSEICLRSFTEQRLPVKTISLKYSDVDHTNEIQHIESLKQDLSLNHQYVEIKLNEFIESKEFNDTVDFVKCVSPIIGCHLWLANQVPGTPIIAQGEAHLKKQVPHDYSPGKSKYEESDWHLYESERLCSIYMNFIKKNKPAIPGFFQYLPEQIFSFLTNNPILDELINNRIIGKLGTKSSKNIMSRQFYSEISMREKLHGWENIIQKHDELRKKLAQRFPNNDDYYKIETHSLIKKLSS